METKDFINVLVSSFPFHLNTYMLWVLVYGHHKIIFSSFSAVSDFRGLILKSKVGPRALTLSSLNLLTIVIFVHYKPRIAVAILDL